MVLYFSNVWKVWGQRSARKWVAGSIDITWSNRCALSLQLLLDAGANVEGAAVRNGQESTADTPLQLASAAGGQTHVHRHARSHTRKHSTELQWDCIQIWFMEAKLLQTTNYAGRESRKVQLKTERNELKPLRQLCKLQICLFTTTYYYYYCSCYILVNCSPDLRCNCHNGRKIEDGGWPTPQWKQRQRSACGCLEASGQHSSVGSSKSHT